MTLNEQRYFADVLKSDKPFDLAFLKVRDPLPAPPSALSFREATHPYAMGENVYSIGYPLSRLLRNGARMTKGGVSAASGMRNDGGHPQISGEVQPGNSGGPLLDHDGYVVGVVPRTISPWRVLQATGGALPQNTDFSLKKEPTLEFVQQANAPAYAQPSFGKAGGLEVAGRAVAKIQAGLVSSGAQGRDKMVVRLNCVSHWDIWYRFQRFVLTAYDYDTQEPLFAVEVRGGTTWSATRRS